MSRVCAAHSSKAACMIQWNLNVSHLKPCLPWCLPSGLQQLSPCSVCDTSDAHEHSGCHRRRKTCSQASVHVIKYIERILPQPGSVMVFLEVLHSSRAGWTSTMSVVTSLARLVLMQSGGTSRFLPNRGLMCSKPFTSVR